MTSLAGELDPGSALPYSGRLVRLMLLPSLPTAEERLEAALGPELTSFLMSALCSEGQGRLGSSSP
jgi:hypothetical protein